ncbi:MAG: S9 family peptidase [Chloroflexi bacterium]|nr:S9 family peptidase [Chloroflexota bacterium]
MADRRRPFTPEDLYGIRWISDPQIAPDSRRVAFTVTQMDQKADDYRSQVWLVPTSGRVRHARPVTFGPKRDSSPRWSPDGRTLAFVSDRAGKAQVWLLPVDGGEARQLTNLFGGVQYLSWAPDGRQVAVVSRVGDDEQRPKIREITTLKYKFNGEGFREGRRHIYVVSVASGRARQLTDGDWDDAYPVWSPDGARIAFASARHESRDLDSTMDIWVVEARGGEPARITPGRGPATAPLWSPDGRTVAYLGHDHPMAGLSKNTCAWVVGASGGRPRNLSAALDRCASTASWPAQYHTLAWTPDGSGLLFLAMDQGNVSLFRTSLRGGRVTPVVAGDAQIAQFSVAANGATAYALSSPTNPGEVYFRGPRGGQRRLTNLNGRFAGRFGLQPPERLAFASADGTPLEGWVVKPNGFQPGRRYPALVNVHGGPHAQYGNVFFDEFQTQAGRGYVVFYPNPRGSQGYGEAFASAVCGDWGGKDYEDVMAGVEALARLDYVDPERLGVLGGSYGGYMASWIVGHTDRFRAACSERAVNNILSMFGTSDIGSYFQEFEMAGARPWENPQFYLERSPISYVAKMRTPLLILHSEQDLRCPMEQGEQLYVALKKLGQADVLFVRFPEESHEMSRSGKPSRRVRRFQYILDWFDKYLSQGAQPARRRRGRPAGRARAAAAARG